MKRKGGARAEKHEVRPPARGADFVRGKRKADYQILTRVLSSR